MTSVGNADLQSQISAQQVVVQEETAELNSLITIKNTASFEKTLATQQANSATVTYNLKNAISFLKKDINENLTLFLIIFSDNAESA
jgi:hypothetical protein